MQLWSVPSSVGSSLCCFNPHPSRRTGATVCNRHAPVCLAKFQSSPVPEDGCNPPPPARQDFAGGFNPHPSRRTGATDREWFWSGDELKVSILTRPGGRVQQPARLPDYRRYLFQSSPVPEDGCNHCRLRAQRQNGVSILTRPGGRVQRARLPSVTRKPLEFQSSPVPEDGCNAVQPH